MAVVCFLKCVNYFCTCISGKHILFFWGWGEDLCSCLLSPTHLSSIDPPKPRHSWVSLNSIILLTSSVVLVDILGNV